MRFSAFKKLFATDYDDAPKGQWLGKLVSNLNLFIDQSTTAFRNNLTFEENFRCQVKTVSINSDVGLQLSYNQVSGVVVLQLDGAMLLGFQWTPLNNGSIEIKVKHDSKSAVPCKLLILQ